jgi:biotin synthase-like enzyme
MEKTEENQIDIDLSLRELGTESAPINLFNHKKVTPLEKCSPLKKLKQRTFF